MQEDQANQEAPHDTEPAQEPAVAKSPMPPGVVVGLAFAIIALLGFLIFTGLRATLTGKPAAASSELVELQAEANALRDQLNRERMAIGLRPLEGNSESVEDLAERLKKDADTMVALVNSLKSMMVEKDAELSANAAELIRSAQLRQTLAAEASRVQGELQRALVEGSESAQLRSELDSMQAQRDALSEELAKARAQLATQSGGVSQEEYDDLRQRFDETLRAKEFFEARAAELEGK